MAFHLGKPVLAMMLVAAAIGATFLLRDKPARAPVEVWTFAQPHAQLYARLHDDAVSRAQTDFGIRLIPNNALNVRLVSLFMADRQGDDLPDIVEIRQDALGRYLAAPVDQIGFLPLNPFLQSRGRRPGAGPGDCWFTRMVQRRFEPYTKDGQIFGLPRDVHPVTLTYRADLFAEAGVDLETPSADLDFVSWPDFQQRCLRFEAYWRGRGFPNRRAIDLFASNAEILTPLLLQRGVNLIEPDGRVRLDDPITLDTLVFYASMVAGPKRVSADSVSGGMGVWKSDLEAGVVCAVVTPDWRTTDLRAVAADGPLAGKFRMCRLPRFESTDAPTTTWGGTMIAIPRKSKNPQRAWRVIEALYLDDAATAAQVRELGILPAVADAWRSPAVRMPDPLFGGQVVNDLYADLAPHIPIQHLTPDTAYASAALGYVLTQAVGQFKSGADAETVRTMARQWLADRQADVQRQIAHGRLAGGQ